MSTVFGMCPCLEHLCGNRHTEKQNSYLILYYHCSIISLIIPLKKQTVQYNFLTIQKQILLTFSMNDNVTSEAVCFPMLRAYILHYLECVCVGILLFLLPTSWECTQLSPYFRVIAKWPQVVERVHKWFHILVIVKWPLSRFSGPSHIDEE